MKNFLSKKCFLPLILLLTSQILTFTLAELSSLPNVTITQLNSIDDEDGGGGSEGSEEGQVEGILVPKPYNSDVIVGEDTDKSRSLLLSCVASYPVQWVYTGDGRPELSTNTSIKFLRVGKKSESPISFTAFATITNPQEKNTGNYTCRSLQDPKIAVYYFIYVPGPTLFTSPGGYDVSFSRQDPTVRIPCSISNPKALVGLQKSVNGLLNCPLNDSIAYNPKTGFHLKTHDFADARGKYICSAAYNNTVRYIEFELVSTDPDLPPTTGSSSSSPITASEPEKSPETCVHNSDCLDHQVCIDKRCSSDCSNFCASNARCRIIRHVPECSCPDFHTGDPYVMCRPKGDTSSSGHQQHHQNQMIESDPCVPSPCGEFGECKMVGKILTCTCKQGFFGTPPNCRARQCVESKECPSNEACILGVCSDPCITGVCGKNSNCRVVNRSPVCSCMAGFEGDPFDECRRPTKVPANHQNHHVHPIKIDPSKVKNSTSSFQSACSSLACGRNAQCSLLGDGRPICRCEIGFNFGDPYNACYTQNELAHNPCLSSPCGPNTICSRNSNGSALCTCMPDTEGNAYVGCKHRTCIVHGDCPKNQTCVGHRCQDGCLNRNTCGVNARCSTEQHVTRCHCLPDFTGNAERECYKMPTRPSGPVTPLPIQSSTASGGGGHQSSDPCSPSPCAKNAECSIFRGRALCRCNYGAGDPLVSCEQRCQKTAQCPDHQVCYVVNSTCVDVCGLYDVGCGPHAMCKASNHMPGCYRKPESLTETEQQHGGDGGDRVCSVDADCPLTKKCFVPNGRCLDPCKFRGVCGASEECRVVNHRPSCVYREDQHQHHQNRPPSQSPNQQVHQQQHQQHQSCQACGPYSECQITRGIIVCTCKQGMIGSAPYCRPECQYDSECGFDKACIAFKCQDPCVGACGQNSLCKVRQRTPVCSCPKGYYGNPIYRCSCCNNQRTGLHNDATAAASNNNPDNDDDEYDEEAFDSTLTPILHFIKRLHPNQTSSVNDNVMHL